MKHIDKGLLESCQKHPEKPFVVIITMCRDASWEAGIPGLSADECKEIGPGIFRATLAGNKVLELSQRDDIVEIIADFKVSIP